MQTADRLQEAQDLKDTAIALQRRDIGPVGPVIEAMNALLSGCQPDLEAFKSAKFDVSQFPLADNFGTEGLHMLYGRASRLLGIS